MTNKEKKDKSKPVPWVVTITLLAALAASYYQWNRHTTQKKSYGVVMGSYTPPVNKGARSNTIGKGGLSNAIKEFDLKNYDLSYTLLQSIKTKTDSVYWYLGHIALIKGKVYEAKNHSKKIKDESLKGSISKYVDLIISK